MSFLFILLALGSAISLSRFWISEWALAAGPPARVPGGPQGSPRACRSSAPHSLPARAGEGSLSSELHSGQHPLWAGRWARSTGVQRFAAACARGWCSI